MDSKVFEFEIVKVVFINKSKTDGKVSHKSEPKRIRTRNHMSRRELGHKENPADAISH